MSSPSRQDGGLPPDPPQQQEAPPTPPQPSNSSSPDTPPPQQQQQQGATAASPSTPQTAGSAAGTAAPTSPSTGSGSGSASRRPLTSVSYFIPFNGNGGQATENGERYGLTYTVEIYTNDAEGMAAANAPDDDELNAGGDVGAPPNATGGHAEEGTQAPTANPGTDAQPAAPGADDQEPPRRVIFVIGPDGRMLPRPGVDPTLANAAAGLGAFAAAGLRAGGFLMPFPFPFHAPAPAPDPAKAAELLASLPTVGRALLRRIDKIVTAEDEASGKEDEDRGWRCGICLEGIVAPNEAPAEPNPEPSSQTVKALPCNHLFHEECLQPWFTSHHTCPTCRLDLDPMRTLNPPRQARGVRPPATGSGRATPTAHPYARGGATRPARPASTVNGSEASSSRPGSQPSSRPATPTTDRAPPTILDGLRLFDAHPMVASPVPMDRGELPQRSAQEPRAEPAQPAAGPSDSVPPAAPSAAPAAPALAPPRLGVSASVPSSPQIGGPAGSDNNAPGLARPTPERRPHIHIFPFTFGNATPNQPRAGSEPPATTATPPSVNGPRDQLHDFDEPRMRLPFDWLFMNIGGPPQPEEPAPAQTETPPPVPVERQSLESWTKEREKTLGWRCDGVECLIAPPVPESDDKDEDMAVDDETNEAIDAEFTSSDKEMVAIYASNQAPFSEGISINEEQAHPHADYVLLACKHRWHRACLETAERTAGHTIKADAEGREWVRCGRCRKEGWIVPRHDEVPAASTAAAAPIDVDV